MKSQLMKIFGDPAVQGDSGGVPAVKDEVLCVNEKVKSDEGKEDVLYGQNYRRA